MIFRVTNLRQVQEYLSQIPGRERNAARQFTWKSAKSLQRRMRRRVPKNTGHLKNSIKAKRTGQEGASVRIGADYAMAVEKGRGPNKATGSYLIPVEYIETHLGNPGARRGHIQNPSFFVDLRNTPAVTPRPFIEPSLKTLRKDIPKIINPILNKELRAK